jgi:signal transduction histidine kinase
MAEMLDRDRVSSPERKKIYYSTMLHESERLSHLVENILDFARMEQGRKQYNFTSGQIEETVEDAVETFRLQTENKDVHLDFQSAGNLPPITYDREAMEQIMHNLLDNALKYGGAKKRIHISVNGIEGLIVIKVRDWGIGIAKEEQGKIFNRFYRVGDELTGKVKGSGIGLTIVRQIVEDHHGKVTVKSKSGEGSTFTILLPIKS